MCNIKQKEKKGKSRKTICDLIKLMKKEWKQILFPQRFQQDHLWRGALSNSCRHNQSLQQRTQSPELSGIIFNYSAKLEKNESEEKLTGQTEQSWCTFICFTQSGIWIQSIDVSFTDVTHYYKLTAGILVVYFISWGVHLTSTGFCVEEIFPDEQNVLGCQRVKYFCNQCHWFISQQNKNVTQTS